MSKQLVKQAKLNAFSSYINFMANAILTFFFNPLLVKYLGGYNFGIWKACQRLLDFATIADGRATQSLKFIIANKEGKSDTKDKQQAVGSALKIWVYFLPFLLVIVGLLIWFLPLTIKGVQGAERNIVQMLGLILGINILLNPLMGIPDAVLVGINQAHKSTNNQTLWLVWQNVFMVVAAALGYGVIGLGAVVLIATVSKGLNVLYICKKNTPWLGVQKPEQAQIKEFVGFSFWVLIWSFISKLMMSTETILLGYLTGAVLVAKYTFSAYISQLGLAMAMVTGAAVIPGLGKVLGDNDKEKAQKIVIHTREIVFYTAMIFGGGMLILNKTFITLWMGADYYLGDTINLLICLIMVQLIMVMLEAQIQDISLKIKYKVIFGVVSSILSIICGAVIYKLSGNAVAGIFLGIIVGRLILSLLYPFLVNRFLSLKGFDKKYIFGIALLGACYYAGTYLPVTKSWLLFGLLAIVFGIVLLTVSYFLFLSLESKKLLLSKFSKG